MLVAGKWQECSKLHEKVPPEFQRTFQVQVFHILAERWRRVSLPRRTNQGAERRFFYQPWANSREGLTDLSAHCGRTTSRIFSNALIFSHPHAHINWFLARESAWIRFWGRRIQKSNQKCLIPTLSTTYPIIEVLLYHLPLSIPLNSRQS